MITRARVMARRVWAAIARAAGVGTPVVRAIRRAGTTLARVTPRWLRRWSVRVLVAFVGAVVGLLIGAHTDQKVGPFDASLNLRLGVAGGSEVRVPPLGSLEFDTHAGPVRISATMERLRQAEAQELLSNPDELAHVGDNAAREIQHGLIWLAVKGSLSALAGAGLVSVIVYRRRVREPFIAIGVAATMLAGVGGGAAGTWRPSSLTEPTYSGLLANAPAVVGDFRSIVSRFDAYREELAGLITNVSKLYTTVSGLPTFQPDNSTIRVLHISDLHLSPTAYSVTKSVVDQFNVDVVADTGDLTDFGSEPERNYVKGISTLGVPYVWVRGNHDSAKTQAAVEAQPNAVVLDGQGPVAVGGLTFLGQGDPRFTPDKETRDDDASVEQVQSAGEDLAGIVEGLDGPPDVTMLHDPLSAIPLKDKVPLVLAGHQHSRDAERLGDTLVLVGGSTGGAGLRGLEGEEPTPIELSVLYFDAPTHELLAHDDITMGGLGLTEATIERHVVGGEPQAGTQ